LYVHVLPPIFLYESTPLPLSLRLEVERIQD
jgi:hypothetical protein